MALTRADWSGWQAGIHRAISIRLRWSLLHILSPILAVLALLPSSAIAGGKTLPFTLCCSPDNDLYSVLLDSGYKCPRCEDAAEAVTRAPEGTAVLILAEAYPDVGTKADSSVLEAVARKHLRLYIEYPESLPGFEFGKPKHTFWERAVIATDDFGGRLPKLSILTINDCTFTPVDAPNPMMVVARVAGYDKGVYGIPEGASPLLFRVPETDLFVAMTKLSGFVTGRYAPHDSWKVVWEHILSLLAPDENIGIDWTPDVHPAFGPHDRLPKDVERRALQDAATWYRQSRLLIHPSRRESIYRLMKTGAESLPPPSPEEPVGDGSEGIQEGYASAIRHDGSQLQRLPIRADCNAEVAMAMALDSSLNHDKENGKIAENLLDFVYFKSGMCRGARGNPKSPAFGLIAWGDVIPAWEIANYGDDNARVLLATMAAAACLKSDKWDVPLLRGLLANLRTTGTLGFRGDRIDMPAIESKGWRFYHDAQTINYAPHFESYLWACYLWAYRQTHYRPFLEKTKTGIRMMMKAYPSGWRWGDSIERARMLLCLSWLIRLEDTPEHRQWLKTISDDLLQVQQPCGALEERINESGGGGHYFAPKSNEAYGTGETPLIQQNGDPASDQLYTTGFALLGLHEAAAATGDPKLKQAEDKLADYLCRIQVKSSKHPNLDGAWFRAFDFKRWDYWSSSADLGWGAWSIETGWGSAWIAAVLGFRVKSTSMWDLTSGIRIDKWFAEVRKEMESSAISDQ